MSPLIKICGLKSAEIIDTAIDAGADFIGFVHFAKSPRYLDLPDIGGLIKHIDHRVKTVVLLVDPDEDLLAQVLSVEPDYVQLHGHETPERVAQVRQMGVKVIKALPIGTRDDLADIETYAAEADMILLDAKPPKDAAHPGGNGEVFDWSLLKALDPNTKFMLSGGLSIENVAQAVAEVAPYALDVSSGVEVRKGEKDAAMIKEFIRRARG